MTETMTRTNSRLIRSTIVGMVISIFLICSSPGSAQENPRKALARATKNLMKMAQESGYSSYLGVVAGLSQSGDHSIEEVQCMMRTRGYVRGKLMHLPAEKAYLFGSKVVVADGKEWTRAGESRSGREIDGLLEVPTDLLASALRRGSKVDWVPGETNRIRIELPDGVSRIRLKEIDRSGCVSIDGSQKSYFQNNLHKGNVQTTLTVDLDEDGKYPIGITVVVLAAFKDSNGRTRSGELAFEEGTKHAAFHCFYMLDTSDAVPQFTVPVTARKLLK